MSLTGKLKKKNAHSWTNENLSDMKTKKEFFSL